MFLTDLSLFSRRSYTRWGGGGVARVAEGGMEVASKSAVSDGQGEDAAAQQEFLNAFAPEADVDAEEDADSNR